MTEITLERIVIACVTALPPTLMAMAAFRQGRANHKQVTVQTELLTKKTENTALTLADKVEETAKTLAIKVDASSGSIETKASALLVKADEIHLLTNGNLALVKAQLSAALTRIGELEKTIAALMLHA